MAWPDAINVYINFKLSPINSGGVVPDNFVDVTADILGAINITRGRQSELDKYSAGTCSFTLMNRDRKYDFTNTAGPYYGLLVPRLQVYITVTHASTFYNLYMGYIKSGFPQSYDNLAQMSTVQIDCVDLFDMMAQRQWSGGPSETYHRFLRPYRLFNLTNEAEGADPQDETTQLKQVIDYQGLASLMFVGDAYANDKDGASKSVEAQGTVAKFNGHGYGYTPSVMMTPGNTWSVGGWFRARDRANHFDNTKQAAVFRIGGSLFFSIQYNAAIPNDLTARVFLVNAATANTLGMTGPKIGDDAWHFITITSDPSGVYLYVDGSLHVQTAAGTWNQDANHTCDNFTGGWIGWEPGGSRQPLVGWAFQWFTYAATLDITTIQALYQAGLNWPGMRTGERISEMLHVHGLDQGTPTLHIDTGYGYVQDAEAYSNSLLETAQEIADAEGGYLYVESDGSLYFRNRYTTITASRSVNLQATFGDSSTDIRFTDAAPVLDLQFLYNQVDTSIKGGPTYRAEDSGSIINYDIRGLDRSGLPLANSNDAISGAQWVVYRYSEPIARLPSVTYSARFSSAALLAALNLTLLDYIRVKRKPQNVGASQWSFDAHIEGINMTIDLAALTFDVSYYLTQYGVVSGFLRTDDTTFKLDSGKLGW